VTGEQLDLYRGEARGFGLIRLLEEEQVLTEMALHLDRVEESLLTFDRVEALARMLGELDRATPFWIGDILTYSEQRWGERFAQIADTTGLHPDTLTRYQAVAAKIPADRRVAELSFRHHQAVQTLEPGEQRSWLGRAAEGGWNSQRLRAEIAERAPEPTAESTPAARLERALDRLEKLAMECELFERDDLKGFLEGLRSAQVALDAARRRLAEA
jgi:hypothetical protein